MNTSEKIKKVVRDKYADIAKTEKGCGCGCGDEPSQLFGLDYSTQDGYFKNADLSLGCGIPTEYAAISSGDTVVDLGCGAGNDVFIVRRIVGESGKVIGIDMTQEMIDRAEENKNKLGYNNVEFKLGEIENTPLAENSADVVVSNCVLNLVPDKEKAFKEIHRILKEGGHFSVSDIVLDGPIPESIKKSAELYAGCVSGALQKSEYLGAIKQAGFKNIQIKKEREINLPDETIEKYISKTEIKEFRESGAGIYSITVYADKLEEGSCCDSGDGECCGSGKSLPQLSNKESTCC